MAKAWDEVRNEPGLTFLRLKEKVGVSTLTVNLPCFIISAHIHFAVFGGFLVSFCHAWRVSSFLRLPSVYIRGHTSYWLIFGHCVAFGPLKTLKIRAKLYYFIYVQ